MISSASYDISPEREEVKKEVIMLEALRILRQMQKRNKILKGLTNLSQLGNKREGLKSFSFL
jgi:hypothetical protein